MAILTFEAAIEEAQRYSKRHLLLGNGFSIALRPDIFQYGKVFFSFKYQDVSRAMVVRNSDVIRGDEKAGFIDKADSRGSRIKATLQSRRGSMDS